jgi:hypothetical protein
MRSHDAFDRVADALESGDPKLGQLVADADEAITGVASGAPLAWEPDLEVLRLALGAVNTDDRGGKGGPKKG